MQFLLIATAIMGLVQAGVGLAEKLMSGTGKGAEKKAAVLDGVINAVATGVSTGTLRGDFKGIDPEALRGGVSMLIDMAVTIFNKLGWTTYTLDSPDTTVDPKIGDLANQP
jgi:hypothetical protein